MRTFDYAAPRREADVLALRSEEPGQTEILAGGTDLIGLMKAMVVQPRRVVNIMEVPEFHGIEPLGSGGLQLGATTHLDELLESPYLEEYPAIGQAIRGISSIQLQCQGTLGGEILQRARCWYFRQGQGLLAHEGRLPAEGDNRYHAIFGNSGPAKFVCGSRLAPAMIVLGAEARVIGPAGSEDEEIRERWLPVEDLYRAPRHEGQRETVLEPGQLVTHFRLPAPEGISSGAYEVRHGEGPDYPLMAAAAALRISGGVVREARVVLGQAAPIPWRSREAELTVLGGLLTPELAEAAGEAAAQTATPLSQNGYKVQLARTAVKRALLLAAGLPTGGF